MSEEMVVKRGSGKRVLLVEDDVFVREVYARKLGSEGFDIDEAENGMQALEILGKRIPDIILLDIHMPLVDGRDVLREIARHDEWKPIPVILLTNLCDSEGVRFGFRQGVKEYLIKSHFTPSQVVAKIYAVLEESSGDGTMKDEHEESSGNPDRSVGI